MEISSFWCRCSGEKWARETKLLIKMFARVCQPEKGIRLWFLWKLAISYFIHVLDDEVVKKKSFRILSSVKCKFERIANFFPRWYVSRLVLVDLEWRIGEFFKRRKNEIFKDVIFCNFVLCVDIIRCVFFLVTV